MYNIIFKYKSNSIIKKILFCIVASNNFLYSSFDESKQQKKSNYEIQKYGPTLHSVTEKGQVIFVGTRVQAQRELESQQYKEKYRTK